MIPENWHAPIVLASHQYLLCREAFDADVVISLPKLKMHSKAGLTGALKNLVGLNGNKDFLPHYRFGGSAKNGDCYEGWSLGRELSERFEDLANRRLNLLELFSSGKMQPAPSGSFLVAQLRWVGGGMVTILCGGWCWI